METKSKSLIINHNQRNTIQMEYSYNMLNASILQQTPIYCRKN